MRLPHIKLFAKTKRNMKLVSLPHFLHDFLIKILLLLYSINWSIFIVWLPLLPEILGNMFIITVYWPGCDTITFEISQAIFSPFQKIQDKHWNISRMKRAFKIKWKTFFIVFKRFLMKQVKQIFLEGETPTWGRPSKEKSMDI